jgi:hypothetical protein
MRQELSELTYYFSRSIKQNKLLYITFIPTKSDPSPTPAIGTFRGYTAYNKVQIGERNYNIEKMDYVCLYSHSCRIKVETVDNPFLNLAFPPLPQKDQKELEDYFSDWSFRDESF